MSEFRKDAGDVKNLNPGERLGLALGNLKLSQTGLAHECDVSPQYVNNILRRGQRITQNLAQQLAVKIGINLNWLFTGDGPMFLEECTIGDAQDEGQLESAEHLLREAAQSLCQVAELLKEHSR